MLLENLLRQQIFYLNFLNFKKTIALFRLLIAESQQFPELAKTITLNKHGPFTQQLISYLTAQVKQKQLVIANIELAAYQFLGLIKEYHFWMRLFGLQKKLQSSDVETSIAHSVQMFLSYYSQ